MRRREQVDQWWEVRGDDDRPIVTTWGDAGKASAWRSVRAAARRGEARTVHRVTRYRLAPLVEIAAWDQARGWLVHVGDVECGDRDAGAFVGRDEIGWMVKAWASGVYVQSYKHRTKRAAMAAAEAHLAVLGCRVAKGERR